MEKVLRAPIFISSEALGKIITHMLKEFRKMWNHRYQAITVQVTTIINL